jgi:hypothetical protein
MREGAPFASVRPDMRRGGRNRRPALIIALIWPAALLLATGLMCLAALKAWRGWLDFKRFEIASARNPAQDAPEPTAAARIEMANLKERLRKLEAIATGVDL